MSRTLPALLAAGLGALAALPGCHKDPAAAPGVVVPPPPPFQGKPAPQPIDFDLSGTWEVLRFGTAERPGKRGAWTALWRLRRRSPARGRGGWKDENGQGRFALIGLRPPQMLRWDHEGAGPHWFSVNEQSFGFLMMTGDDGERYSAVRTEGGEGR